MEKKKSCCIQGSPVDRISDLPDEILHHILSFRHTKAVAQTSVLSKRWLHIWNSYPILYFFDGDFKYPGKGGYDLERFCDVVDGKLKLFCKYKSGIQRLRLSFSHLEPKYFSLVDKWMELVSGTHVKELYLSLDVMDKYPFYFSVEKYPYHLPQEIFAMKSLTVLAVSCEDTLFPSSIKLPYLVTLSLTGIRFEEMMIFDDHKFPCIEVLQFWRCFIPGGFKISSHRLKELLFYRSPKHGKIEIFGPNLSSMSLLGGLIPTSSFLSLDVPLKLNKFTVASGDRLDTLWYIKLKESIQMQIRTENLTFLYSSNTEPKNTFDKVEASKSCLSPPYALKCLALDIVFAARSDVEALIDGFLWGFRPEILSIQFFGRDAKRLLQVLLKASEGREDRGCWSSSKIQYWRHSIKVKKEKAPSSWDASSKAPCEKINKLEFYLTW